MEISTLSGAVRDVVSTLSVLGLSVGATMTAALLVWVCVRTRSAHPILARLWLQIRGKREIRDAEIQEFMEAQDKLTWFQFMTAIRPRTLKDAKALIVWCHLKNVSPAEVRACGWLFDLEIPGLLGGKAPGRRWLLVGAPAFVALFIGALAAVAVIPGSTLMQTKESHQWFWLSATQARALPGDGGGQLQRDDCAGEPVRLAKSTGFSEHEVNALCGFFNRGDAQQRVERDVKTQRVVFGWVAFTFACFGRMLLLEFIRVAAARRLSKRLVRVETDAAPLPLGTPS